MTLRGEELDKVLSTLRAIDEHRRYRQREFFVPYPKQQEFFTYGSWKRERLLFGGNRVGKTQAGAYEAQCHLTGEYPDWWKGRRWDRPTSGWMAGESSTVVRDTLQQKLCGEPGIDELFGTGLIPREKFVGRPSLSRGVTDSYDTIAIRHKSGGISTAQFKSYEQGRAKFQGVGKDWVWLDEEPGSEIYHECLTRIGEKGGLVYTTFTPLKGRTDLVVRFLDQPSDDRATVTLPMSEATHWLPGEFDKIVAGFAPHERLARMNGVPMQGEGRVFPYPDELISETPLTYIPDHWAKLWGVDFGIGHPFAAVLVLHDRDNDVIHVHHAIRIHTKPGEPGGLPINHAAAMRNIGALVPVAWPHDGDAREHDGVTVAAQYRKQGLLMLGKHATHVEGGYGTEAGILLMDQRMQTGRLKVAKHLIEWFQEFQNYHRKDGLIVKLHDDLMSATRIAVMQVRSARVVTLGKGKPMWAVRADGRTENIAAGLDFELT